MIMIHISMNPAEKHAVLCWEMQEWNIFKTQRGKICIMDTIKEKTNEARYLSVALVRHKWSKFAKTCQALLSLLFLVLST